jgi:hypothetical protein
MVMFGCYSRRFWACPLFEAPPGSYFGEADPGVLAARMREAETDVLGEPAGTEALGEPAG